MVANTNIVPYHIAFIPDGNRRWASMRQLSPWQGHQDGTKRFREISSDAFTAGVTYVTFWAASYDNLQKRSKVEVDYLYKILREELAKPQLLKDFLDNGIKVEVLGLWKEIIHDKKLVEAVENIEYKTAKCTKHFLTILFGYDGKMEMLESVRQLAGHRVTEQGLRKGLMTGHLPDVDLVVRTGGEPHWSAGFMMWLTANSQFYFTETLWPDFDKKHLKVAMKEFADRQRRMGK